jgi:hypothetical protein
MEVSGKLFRFTSRWFIGRTTSPAQVFVNGKLISFVSVPIIIPLIKTAKSETVAPPAAAITSAKLIPICCFINQHVFIAGWVKIAEPVKFDVCIFSRFL